MAIKVNILPNFSIYSDSHIASKSREAHQKQKELTATRKASKPNADDIAAAKKLWEKLRRKSHVPKDERRKLVAELFEIITGRVHDFVFKHDSVRVIQCAVKYATIAQKREIAKELKGTFKSLAESRYGKFLLAKMIVECDQETKDLIIPEFYGHIRRLINHPEASWIIDDIYRSVASNEQKAVMLREWYGPEYAVFKGQDPSNDTAELDSILAYSPEKKMIILNYLHERINQLIQKKMTGFTILHDAMLQYFKNISHESEQFSDFQRLIIGDKQEEETDLLRNLAFTQPGSEVVCLSLAWSTAKDRRQILKAYKDVMEMMAYDKWGHRVLLAALDVLDDTRELLQRIYQELVLLKTDAKPDEQAEKIQNLAINQWGHITLVYPYIGIERRIVSPDSVRVLQQVQMIRRKTSKKDPDTRRKEIITPLSPLCLHTIELHAAEIASTSYGCQFICDALIDSVGSKDQALNAVAKLVDGNVEASGHIAQSPFGGKLLKTLISGGRYDRSTKQVIPMYPPLRFAERILDVIKASDERNKGKDLLHQWILSEGAFVILHLLDAPWENTRDSEYVKEEVVKHELALQRIVAMGTEEESDQTKAALNARKAKAAQLLLAAIR
jgi:pumilio family protein 6